MVRVQRINRIFFIICVAQIVSLTSNASSAPAAATAQFSVVAYGAIGDGKTMNTDAFRATIAACSAAGGGRVVIPEGTFLTGPIELKSNVELHVNAGAVVLFSTRFEDYPLAVVDYEGRATVACRSPIGGDHLDHISITGPGMFDAQGDAWRPIKKSKVSAARWREIVSAGGVVDQAGSTWYPSIASRDRRDDFQKLRDSPQPPRLADYAPFRQLLRPCLLLLSNCTNVVIDGPTFRNSPNWNLHLLLSDRITVRNVTIFNPDYAQNGDGIDLDSCRDVLLTDSKIDAGDDGICLKSGRDEEGRERARPTENITVTHCNVGHAHGGFVIGSEMSGGVRNVHVSDCTFHGTDTGLRFKSTRGRGGVVENIHISDITMTDIRDAAITFDMYYFAKTAAATSQPVGAGTPIFRQFQIENITCEGARRAIFMRGLPEMPLSQMTLKNIHIRAEQGVSITDASEITLSNVHVDCATAPPLQTRSVNHLITSDSVFRVDGKR